jgi:hypothetical protein
MNSDENDVLKSFKLILIPCGVSFNFFCPGRQVFYFLI